ncbi:MAG TPA: Gfo/Idh/MocA family oxidoreductase [Candidatus Hydrogenedentes bacterium]|nr:Gfo/Idh/MocA family oxidoreductase [Candidatus Hydrogenedentota bacterium]
MFKGEISRRRFLMGSAAAAASGYAFSSRAKESPPNEKLNIAAIGSGGKGGDDIYNCSMENIVALCDVDWEHRAVFAARQFPKAKKYTDFRVMLEKEDKNIDAVIVSTPDHTHAVAAAMAIKMGKHVYVQKPLTHDIYEARALTDLARKHSVVTQMGNQGHSGIGVRRFCEMIWSGAIGTPREVHMWTHRPVWPQGLTRPAHADPVPEYLDWELWLGTAPERPYVHKCPGKDHECYHPWYWRGWWDFGCGSLGDMGCHIMDPAYWALDLRDPAGVEVVQSVGGTAESPPTACIVRYDFPKRGERPPITAYWYEGGLHPPRPEGIPESQVMGDIKRKGTDGTIVIGDRGVITIGEYGDDPRLLPDALMADYAWPPEKIPRVDGTHYDDWIKACKIGGNACSNFDYAGPFTETVLLGNLALRTGGRIEWDAEHMKVVNNPKADDYVRREYRGGWSL